MRGGQLRLFWQGNRLSLVAFFFFSRTWRAGKNSEQKMNKQWASADRAVVSDIFLRLQSLGKFAWLGMQTLEMTLMVSRVDLGAVAQA